MITNDNLNVSMFNAVRSAIVNSNPKVTESTGKFRRASVKAVYDDAKVTTPQIIISPLSVLESEYTFGSNDGKKLINVSVDCYYNNTLGIDQLSDQVTKAVKDEDYEVLDLVGVSSDYAFVNPNEAKFHLKTVTFTFLKE